MPRVVVPWLNRAEFDGVMVGLFKPRSDDDRPGAVRRLEVWKSRMGSRVPVSVGCTLELFSALAQANSTESLTCTLVSAQLALAMAIVRCVNAVSDIGQKGFYAQTVRSLASQAGIPGDLVDVRHEATHTTLPSIEILITSAETTLQYLYRNYWVPTSAELQRQEVGVPRGTHLQHLVKEFLDVEKTRGRSPAARTKLVRKVVKACTRKSARDCLISCILSSPTTTTLADRLRTLAPLLRSISSSYEDFPSSLLASLADHLRSSSIPDMVRTVMDSVVCPIGANSQLFWISVCEQTLRRASPGRQRFILWICDHKLHSSAASRMLHAYVLLLSKHRDLHVGLKGTCRTAKRLLVDCPLSDRLQLLHTTLLSQTSWEESPEGIMDWTALPVGAPIRDLQLADEYFPISLTL